MPRLLHYILQGVVFILGVVGIHLLGNKKRVAFLFLLGVNIFGISLGIYTEPRMYSSICMNILLIFLNIRNYKKWGKVLSNDN